MSTREQLQARLDEATLWLANTTPHDLSTHEWVCKRIAALEAQLAALPPDSAEVAPNKGGDATCPVQSTARPLSSGPASGGADQQSNEPEIGEAYPGQQFFHKHNPRIKRAEQEFETSDRAPLAVAGPTVTVGAPAPLTVEQVSKALDAAIGSVIDPVPDTVPPYIIREIQLRKLTDVLNESLRTPADLDRQQALREALEEAARWIDDHFSDPNSPFAGDAFREHYEQKITKR
jgi:hypothetical protein